MPKNERQARGTGSVFWSEAKQVWIWRANTGFHPDGRMRRIEGTARTQGEAVRRQREAEKANRQADTAGVTVGQFLTAWLTDTKANVRSTTWASYERCVRLHLVPSIGGVKLTALRPPDVSRMYGKLSRAGMSPGNVRKVSEVLASALETAVAEGTLAVSPTRGAVKPRVTRPAIEVFTDDEVKAILAATADHPLRALYAVAVGTGMRQGELFALDVGDVNLDAGTISVNKSLDYAGDEAVISPPKTKRGIRTIALPGFVRTALADHLDGREPGPLFTDSSGGYLRKSNFVRRQWAPLLRRAEIAPRKFHTLRHTHASRLLADGVDPAEVARRLGDGIDTLLKTYSHWMPTGQNTADRVDRIYAETPEPGENENL